jgi:adenylate cyclase
MSNIVSMHNGIVNKFMGDAILAIYGLDSDGESAAENAINTAMAILEHTRKIELPDGTSLETGIGIHTGRVVAGTIGSEERYEYTFIGDAVNTASRLDGLSKRLGYGIIISEDAYKLLPSHSRLDFVDLGDHDVRGKTDQVHVYGAVRQPIEH